VPTAEVLPSGKWSGSAYRRGTNYVQGFTNVGDFAGTFGVGVGKRAELFGSFTFITRIDRDVRPLFTDGKTGGVIDRYPLMHQTWSGNQVGDLLLGGKINLWSEAQQKPLAMAVRGVIKAPTGDQESGASTGKLDGLFDYVISKETKRNLEVSAFGGYEFRGEPDGMDAASGAFRWGAGVGYPSRAAWRGIFEVNGNVPNADTLTITPGSLVGTDGSVARRCRRFNR